MESTDGESPDTSPIESLPTEILEMILGYLPFQERVRVGRVCKKWKTPERVWRNVQGLYITQRQRSMRMEGNTLYFAADVLDTLQGLLSNAGQYLKALSFFTSPHVIPAEPVLSIIAAHCHNIESIQLSCIEESAVIVLSKLLKVNKQLCSIACIDADNISGILPLRDWKSLDIGLKLEGNTWDEGLVAVLENSPSLESIHVYWWSPDILAALSKCQQLKTLYFPRQLGKREHVMMIDTSLLNRLTRLTLPDSANEVDLVIHLLRHCINLERLTLLRCFGGLPLEIERAVLALPKLEALEIDAYSLSDEILSRLLKFKLLRIEYSSGSITENGIFKMIMNSECLEILELPHMEISMKFFKQLAQNTEDRRKILIIKVSTRIYKEALKICKGSKIHVDS